MTYSVAVQEVPSMLSPTTSQLLQALLAVGYVSSIYVHPNGRLKFEITPQGKKPIKTRNDPLVIRARLTAVVLATILSCAVVIGVVFATLPREEKVGHNTLRCKGNQANMIVCGRLYGILCRNPGPSSG